MRGKRMAPVDYTAYAPSQQQKEETQQQQNKHNNNKHNNNNNNNNNKTHKSLHNVCNRTIPYIIWDATENSPLFSSFSRNGYDPDVSLRWLRGKNEFDRQLASARHHARVLQRREKVEKLRQKLLNDPNAETVISASLLAEENADDADDDAARDNYIATRSTAWTHADSVFTHTVNSRTSTWSAGDKSRSCVSGGTYMPYIKSNGTTGSIRPRSATMTTIAGRTLESCVIPVFDSTCSVKSTTATPQLACVRHSCLVVQDSAKLPPTMGFVSEVCLKSEDNDNNNSSNKSENKNKKKRNSSNSSIRENKINIMEPVWPRGEAENTHLSRFYDERLMRVIRENTAIC